jgi:FkbM family methyltransferase
MIGFDSVLNQSGRNLVIHTPVAQPEPLALASIICALGGQKGTFFFHLKSKAFAKTSYTRDNFRDSIRRSLYRRTAKAVRNRRFRRILVIPSSLLDIAVGITAADITGVSMVFLLISDEPLKDLEETMQLISEALAKADLIFTANEEIRSKLPLQYREKICLLPKLESTASAGKLPPTDNGRLLTSICEIVNARIDPVAPKEIHWEMRPHFLALQRLKNLGYRPDFIIDVGASTGYWSHLCHQVFSSSQFYLFEPLVSEYRRIDSTIYDLHPEFTVVEVAVSNRAENIKFNVAPDLYGSSLLADSGSASKGSWKQVQVPAKTLAALAREFGVKGRGIMKIDVQFAEHLVLEGAGAFLEQIDVVFVELSLGRLRPQAKTFAEMLNYLRAAGFEYFDVAGWWREPQTAQLVQQDAVFARTSLSTFGY